MKTKIFPSKTTDYKWTKIPKKFKWKNDSKAKFSRTIQNEKHRHMINDVLKTQYSLQHSDIELASKAFTDIIISAAKSSLSVSNSQKSKNKSNKT